MVVQVNSYTYPIEDVFVTELNRLYKEGLLIDGISNDLDIFKAGFNSNLIYKDEFNRLNERIRQLTNEVNHLKEKIHEDSEFTEDTVRILKIPMEIPIDNINDLLNDINKE